MPIGLPVVVVIGDRPIVFLKRALDRIAQVSQRDSIGEGRPDVVLYAATFGGDNTVFHAVQRQAAGLSVPLLVYLEGVVTDAHRRTWIEKGAIEVLARHQVVDAVLRRLPGGYRPTTSSFLNDLLAMVSPPPDARSENRNDENLMEVEPEPITGEVLLAPDLVDPISSFLEAAPKFEVPEIPVLTVPSIPKDSPAATFLRSISEYHVIRRALLSRLGTTGGRILNSLVFHRTRAIENLAGPILPDTFGMWKRDPRTPLGWSAQVVEPSPISVCEILNASADGVCIKIRIPPPEDKHLVIQLEVEETLRAELGLESRWQRRTSRDNWEMGAVIIHARIQDL